MAIALSLAALKDTKRKLYLYDTFDDGWPAPGVEDETVTGLSAHEQWRAEVAAGEVPDVASYDAVRQLMASTQYPMQNIVMVKGNVLDTIPGSCPDSISLLRLDTDWYDSTRHELEHLYPRLVQGGVLMIDDYGSWQGTRKAVDEYFGRHNINMLLHRVDALGYRIGIKA